MPEPKERTDPEFDMLDGLRKIQISDEWRHYLTILKDHRAFCMNKARCHLRQEDDRKASVWLAKADNTEKIASLLSEKINQLKKTIEGRE